MALFDAPSIFFLRFPDVIGVRETGRDLTFCSYTILSDQVMVVPDTLADERFVHNGLVTGEPYIRFYAGAPLITSDGFHLGSFCIIDTRPRELSEAGKQILVDLAAVVVDEMELKRAGALVRDESAARRKAEELLRGALRENSQLMTAINSATAGVLVSDPRQPDNPTTFINPAFTAITGYELEEIIGLNCRFLQGVDTDPATVKELREAIAAQRSISCTLLNYRKDGTPFWNKLTVNPVFDEDGQLINFIGLQTDVTARVNAEAALRESETRFRGVVMGAALIMWALDPEGRFTLSIGSGLRALGLEPGQVVGQSVFDIYKDHPLILSQVRRALAGETLNTTVEVGDLIFAVRYSPVYDAESRLSSIIGVGTDVTERRRAEEALQQSEEKFRAMIENALDIITVLDSDGSIRYDSPSVERVLGYTPVEMIGRSAFELIHPDDIPVAEGMFSQIVGGQAPLPL